MLTCPPMQPPYTGSCVNGCAGVRSTKPHNSEQGLRGTRPNSEIPSTRRLRESSVEMNEERQGTNTLVRMVVGVDEAAQMLSVSRGRIYELIRSGQLRTVKCGARRLVPIAALREYVEGAMGGGAA